MYSMYLYVCSHVYVTYVVHLLLRMDKRSQIEEGSMGKLVTQLCGGKSTWVARCPMLHTSKGGVVQGDKCMQLIC